jgi:hypothetical protein
MPFLDWPFFKREPPLAQASAGTANTVLNEVEKAHVFARGDQELAELMQNVGELYLSELSDGTGLQRLNQRVEQLKTFWLQYRREGRLCTTQVVPTVPAKAQKA